MARACGVSCSQPRHPSTHPESGGSLRLGSPAPALAQGNAILAANACLSIFSGLPATGSTGLPTLTEALVGEAIGARRVADFRAVLKASAVSAFTVAAALSLFYLVFGRNIIALFTNQEEIRALAALYLPWLVVLPLVAVWSFLLEGVFIGATRAQELRNSMLISLIGFLALAVVLAARFGNHGLWCAMLAFMALRAITLALYCPQSNENPFSWSKTRSRLSSRVKYGHHSILAPSFPPVR